MQATTSTWIVCRTLSLVLTFTGQELYLPSHLPVLRAFLQKKGEGNLTHAEAWPVDSLAGPSGTDFRLQTLQTLELKEYISAVSDHQVCSHLLQYHRK